MRRGSIPVVTTSAVAMSMLALLGVSALAGAPSAAATSVVSDDFTRSVSSGFGTAPVGGTYANSQSTGLEIDGSQAVMALSASVSRSALVGPADVRDVDAVTSFAVSALPTAGSVYISQMLRTATSGAHFSPRLRVMPDKKIYLGLRYVDGSGNATSLGTDVTLGFQAAANSRISLRSQIEGSILRTKAWLKGSAEPTNWQLAATAKQLPSAGRFGVWGYLGGSTNSLRIFIDDVAVVPLTSTPTPTPAPTPTPTPSPTATRPGQTNTGVPAGTTLTVHSGDLTITTAGTVIDRFDIRGVVRVKAPNVTIRRSVVRGGATPTVGMGLVMITTAGASNFLIEDSTLAPTNPSPYFDGVKVNQSGTLRRVNISGTVDGVSIYGSGVRIESSYLHHFQHFASDPNQGGGASHDDAIQVLSGAGHRIIGNTLQGAYNAAVMINQDNGATTDLWINNNWVDGGGCSLNYSSSGARKTGMQANNNRFGRSQRVVGCAIIHNANTSDLTPSGNVWDDTGSAIAVNRGS